MTYEPSPQMLGNGQDMSCIRCSADWSPPTGRPWSRSVPGVREIRIHTKVEHRVIYIAKFVEAVYVPHAFEKRTWRTRPADVELARRRLATVLAARRAR